jgi:hypothetical protein
VPSGRIVASQHLSGDPAQCPGASSCGSKRTTSKRDEPLPVCGDETSAEAAEEKRVAECPLRKRACKRMKRRDLLVALNKTTERVEVRERIEARGNEVGKKSLDLPLGNGDGVFDQTVRG